MMFLFALVFMTGVFAGFHAYKIYLKKLSGVMRNIRAIREGKKIL